MKYFPVFLNVAQKPIALVGGGAAAVAKLRLLLKTEAEVTVYDPGPRGANPSLGARRPVENFKRAALP
jgi:uroporphyrin-III C-methyltransferase/precorrin-2 dehydrogenase/sirohydrochlorin ferrochelatase